MLRGGLRAWRSGLSALTGGNIPPFFDRFAEPTRPDCLAALAWSWVKCSRGSSSIPSMKPE